MARQSGKFQVIYHKHILIPTDPHEVSDSEIHVRYKTKCDLSDFFREWETDRLETKKHHDIAQQLTEMLEKGLFRCSPEMVFKVIVSLRVP